MEEKLSGGMMEWAGHEKRRFLTLSGDAGRGNPRLLGGGICRRGRAERAEAGNLR